MYKKYEAQVLSDHYKFSKYLTPERWASIWHQINEITKIEPNTVLEIGPGNGLLKTLLNMDRINVTTLDYVEDTHPDIIASATNIPLSDNSFDVCCAFQMLEHVKYQDSLIALKEMIRVSRKKIIISLPDAEIVYPLQAKLPRGLKLNLQIKKIFQKRKEHKFDGQHYWEINKKEYPLKKIENDISEIAIIKKSYRAPLNPYHHFFVLEKRT
ncbi:hypothetical protein THS27_17600 [Thalassospira sp. MCCC 1A01428]|nr:hypothetical protein THS27_17600 [Thalassospira sp. MCCC 1A01428]